MLSDDSKTDVRIYIEGQVGTLYIRLGDEARLVRLLEPVDVTADFVPSEDHASMPLHPKRQPERYFVRDVGHSADVFVSVE